MRSNGIDLATTNIKGAVLNLDTRALEHVTRQPFPDRVPGLPRLQSGIAPWPGKTTRSAPATTAGSAVTTTPRPPATCSSACDTERRLPMP